MGLKDKERKWFNDGLLKARALVQFGGLDLLDNEIKMRVVNNAPAGVSAFDIKKASREYASKELRIVATALAHVISKEMGFPPSVCIDFLHEFKNKCDLYRMSDDEFLKDAQELNKDSAYMAFIERFNKDEI